MRGSTHELAGIAAGLAYASYTGSGIDKALIITGITAAAAMLPDIDIKESRISQKSAAAGRVISTAFSHRGFWHTPFCWLMISGIFLKFAPEYIAMSILIGSFSHLLLDMLNPAGIPVMFPFSFRKTHFANLMTGGITEIGVMLLLVVLIAAEVIVLVNGGSI